MKVFMYAFISRGCWGCICGLGMGFLIFKFFLRLWGFMFSEEFFCVGFFCRIISEDFSWVRVLSKIRVVVLSILVNDLS